MKRRDFVAASAATLVMARGLSGQSKQMAQTAPVREREMVIPEAVIRKHGLRPVTGSLVPYVLGYDGQPYALDDLLRIMCEAIWR